MRRRLPASVVALGVVSLLTDFSSEMIYPLLPAFLVTLGAGGAMIGLIEGIAETTASLLKLASGIWADRLARKKPLVVAGYGLASFARPLVAIVTAPWQVLAVRFTDRIGKGLRTSPRDALIANATPADRRGAAYGFHRAMDHTGALIGPLVAYALLTWVGLVPRSVFALAAIPGVLAVVVLVAAVREPSPASAPPASVSALASPPGPKLVLPSAFRRYLVILAIFTLANASDAFLLLRAADLGVPLAHVPLLWAALHLVKSTLSTPLGAWSDRLGRRQVIVLGWVVYVLSYLGFGLAHETWQAWALFLFYGLYAALAEGAEKALVADLAPAALRGRAFGAFHFVVGICALPSSLGFGLVWQWGGHDVAFFVSAGLAAVAAVMLALLIPQASSAARPGSAPG